MNFFSNILQPLIDVFEWILVTIHDTLGFSWGLSIVAMTVVVRAALLPLAIRQYKSMRAMQRLSPQIKELQAKYKNDKQRLNKEMMAFYQENKVNPAGACLPLVFQLPVFISLFYMLRKDLRLDICPTLANGMPNPPADPQPCGNIPAAQFLGIPDITDKAVGTTLIVLIVLYVGSQLISSLVMSMPTADRNQRLLMMALPFVFVPFVIGFPAGLLVYWITTNVWTMLQQFTIRETLAHRWDRQHADAMEAAGKLPPEERKGGGGWFGALAARASQASESTKDGGKVARPAEASGPRAAPPPPPRKKKKRSGRRR